MKNKYPLIKFTYSEILQNYIIKNKISSKEIEKFAKRFKRFYKIKKEKIFKPLLLFTSLNWKKENIDVWFFSGEYESISDPLLLNINFRNFNFTFFEFINMLVCNLFSDNSQYFKNVNYLNFSAMSFFITKKVVENIFSEKIVKKLCKESEFDGTYKFIWEKEKELEKEWDLNKKPLIEWIKKN